MNKLSAEIVDLTASLELTHTHTKKNWQGTIPGKKRTKKSINRGQSHRRWSFECSEVSEILIELEDRSRRNNLRLDAIKE